MLKKTKLLSSVGAVLLSLASLPAYAQNSELEAALKKIAALEQENAWLKAHRNNSEARIREQKTNKQQIKNTPIQQGSNERQPYQELVVASQSNWSGFYTGLNAGYGWGTSNGVPATAFPVATLEVGGVSSTPLAPLSGVMGANSGFANLAQSGFIGGAQVGYNYQINSSILIGLETDIQGANIRSSGGYTGAASLGYLVLGSTPGQISSVGTGSISAGIDWLGTVRGRFGYVLTPSFLVFATGGLTYAGTSTSYNTAGNFLITVDSTSSPFLGSGYGGFTNNQSSIRTGWNVGGGFEWMIMNNWSLKAEALYYDLGTENISTAAFVSAPIFVLGSANAALFSTAKVSYSGAIARAGVNYHFNLSSLDPVITKY